MQMITKIQNTLDIACIRKLNSHWKQNFELTQINTNHANDHSTTKDP
jgi:hypothetical protein